MSETSSKVEEFRERIRSRHVRNAPPSRFKIPWYVLIINFLLIAFILFIFNRRGEQENRRETLIEYGGIAYHFVISRETDGNDYLLTLTTRSLSEKTLRLDFQQPMAAVGLYRGTQKLFTTEVGRGMNKVELRPSEIRSFTGRIPGGEIREISEDNPGMAQPLRRSLVMSEERHLPVTVRLKINTEPPVSMIFNFKLYGVN